MEWIILILYFLSSICLCKYKNDIDYIPYAIAFCYFSIYFFAYLVCVFTFKFASHSIFMFYLCFTIVIAGYIYQTFKTTKNFKNFFKKTRKKGI